MAFRRLVLVMLFAGVSCVASGQQNSPPPPPGASLGRARASPAGPQNFRARTPHAFTGCKNHLAVHSGGPLVGRLDCPDVCRGVSERGRGHGSGG